MKKNILAIAALSLLTLTGCVAPYPYRTVVYPVDPNQPPAVVYVPSYDPVYVAPYYGTPLFGFYWGGGSCNNGGGVHNTYNYYGHPPQGGGGQPHPPSGGGYHGGGYHGNAQHH